jgi:alkylation response protein AidB-like acyl-CoA dehydrogenase
VLNGSKAFITSASVSNSVVMAVTDPAPGRRHLGVHPRADMPGYAGRRIEAGLHASNTAGSSSTTCDAGREPLRATLGFVNTMRVLEGGRIAMAAMAVRIAQAPHEALKY